MAGASEHDLQRNESEEAEIRSAPRSSSSNPSPRRAIRFPPANLFIPIFSPPIPPSFTFRRPELLISSDSDYDSSSDGDEDDVPLEISPLDPFPSHFNADREISSNGDTDHDDKVSTSQNIEGSLINLDSDDEDEVICVIGVEDYVGNSVGEDQRDPDGDLDLGEEEAYYNLEFEVYLSADEFEGEISDEFEISDSLEVEGHECFLEVIKHLSSISLTEIDIAENKNLCAICKGEIFVGEKVKRLPCLHHYHSDCIFPWLKIKNTCPLCRFELQAEEPDLRESFAMVTSVVD